MRTGCYCHTKSSRVHVGAGKSPRLTLLPHPCTRMSNATICKNIQPEEEPLIPSGDKIEKEELTSHTAVSLITCMCPVYMYLPGKDAPEGTRDSQRERAWLHTRNSCHFKVNMGRVCYEPFTGRVCGVVNAYFFLIIPI